jgi:uncharacterized protein
MRLGLLSDSHNSMSHLRMAVEHFRQAGVETVIHCGDLTSLEAALQLVEFQIICTFGNGDWNANEIRQNLAYYRPDNFGGLVFRGEIGGKAIAVTHGHLPGILEELILCGEYRYVIHGHSHRRRDELIHSSRVVNPGALGGKRVETRSCAILELERDELTFQDLG